MDKIINSKCICGLGLPWIRNEVIMLDPCEHLLHFKCYIKQPFVCPLCNMVIKKIIRKNDYKKDKTLVQKCIDITSMSNFDCLSKIAFDQIIINLPLLLDAIIRIPLIKGIKSAKELCRDILSMNDIHLKIKGLSKLQNGPKVFIANHTSHLDFLTIFYVLETGFLSSSVIKDNIISKNLTNILPLLIIDRGKKGNTVQKMKEYVEKNGSICLFPEGMITYPNTLIRFRTGAFYIGYPIYPIVLKYKNFIADMETPNFIFKMASHQKETIVMKILNPFYPPFDNNKIEDVRNQMGKKGKFVLSRVSNHDINEVK